MMAFGFINENKSPALKQMMEKECHVAINGTGTSLAIKRAQCSSRLFSFFPAPACPDNCPVSR